MEQEEKYLDRNPFIACERCGCTGRLGVNCDICPECNGKGGIPMTLDFDKDHLYVFYLWLCFNDIHPEGYRIWKDINDFLEYFKQRRQP